MKIFKGLFLIALIGTSFMIYSSCGGSEKTEQREMQGKEYTSAYICPMHCDGSGSDEAGKCPVCGMDYVKNEDHVSDGHQHDSHEGHNH